LLSLDAPRDEAYVNVWTRASIQAVVIF
jgi:hypothetical protein